MSQVMCHKVTLSSTKVVLLRDPRIKDQEMAAQLAGGKVGNDGSNVAMAMIMQKEMLKLMLLKVGEHTLTEIEKEDLDKWFSLREYSEVCQAINQLVGDGAKGKFQIEFAPAGSP